MPRRRLPALTPLEKAAVDTVAPVILRLLRPLRAEDVIAAAEDGVSMPSLIREKPAVLLKLKTLAMHFPFYEEALSRVAEEKYIRYFLEKHLKRERPDLYAAIAYNPKVYAWVRDAIADLAKLIQAYELPKPV